MHFGSRCQNCRQHMHFLRIKEHKAVNPDFSPLHKLRLRDFLRQNMHQIFSIAFAPRHGLSKFISQGAEFPYLAGEPFLASPHHLRCLSQFVRREPVAFYLLDGIGQGFRKAPLTSRPRKDRQIRILLMF